MRDYDVRVALRTHLLSEHEDELDRTLLVDELGLCGQARVDIAVVNGSLTGYELKSARDNLDRLPNQVAIYSRVLDFAYLVVANSHLKRARAMLPHWWGIVGVREEHGEMRLTFRRQARKNPAVDPNFLAQLLWRDEALTVLTRYGLDAGIRSKPRDILWHRLAQDLELNELRYEVRTALRERRGWQESRAQRGNASTLLPSDRTPRFLARRLR